MLNDLAQLFYNIYLPTSMAVFIIGAGIMVQGIA
jgi:hypothetical protein